MKDGKNKAVQHARSIDRQVGRNLRAYRQMQQMPATVIANAVGVSFQQMLKYEQGVNRISAGVLWQVSTILEQPIEAFYAGVDSANAPAPIVPIVKDVVPLIKAYVTAPDILRQAALAVLRSSPA